MKPVTINFEMVEMSRYDELSDELPELVEDAIDYEDSVDKIQQDAEQALEDAGFGDIGIRSVERQEE